MAQSRDSMARLNRLEDALVHITDVLVLQSERMDFGFSNLREETRAMRETLIDRLDRLIAVTTNERTIGVERLAGIEQRLQRLEERVGR
jgi:hypothetical protein